MPIIEVHDLKKIYTAHKKAPGLVNSLKSVVRRQTIEIPAVKGVSFTIEQGEIVGFLGPNGAGKTTTLKMLSGILYPTSGTATVLGHTPWEREPVYQRQFSIVMGQKNQLWWDLPAMDSFLLNQVIYDIPETPFRETLDELTSILDVEKILTIQVRKLSLGERMKCELIAALLHRPKVLFLDEPTIGMDVVSQQAIREFIREYNRRTQATIMLTSHYMEDVEALCQRVIIIDHGQIVFDGSLEELVERYTNVKILKLTFSTPVERSALEKFGTVQEYTPQYAVLAVLKSDQRSTASRILQDLPVEDILIAEMDVSAVIREVFGGEKAESADAA